MNVVFAADENYAEPLRVVIASLIRQSRSEALSIWILDGGISAAKQEKIRQGVTSARHSIAFCKTASQIAVGGRTQPHLSDATLLRLFVPALLPDLTRCVYLDVDVYVFATLAPLWATDLLGQPLAMVESAWSHYLDYKSLLGIGAGEPYFNSGVMVMDLDLLRRMGAVERCLEFLDHRKDAIRFADQDVVNAVMRGRIRPLHPQWNVSGSLYDWRPGYSFTFGGKAAQEAIARPHIAHFTGRAKPWHEGCTHPLAPRYRELAAEVLSTNQA